jgi:SpoVK/Ycf46/Vps4 family AAA+-type ATPase
MIDPSTYTQLHSDEDTSADSLSSKDDLGGDAMASDRPPGGNFLLLSPPTVHGYDVNEHRWRKLLVIKTAPVVWNKSSFEQLILDQDDKDHLTAAVKSMISNGHVDNIIGGKGDGLKLLFFGRPGSGKTFAAEAIAELTERPLYRINCGDIGTTVENATRYLKSIFHVINNWECVVLLDDADVFLEPRSPSDIERNALVSVFIRFLENYHGILILKSNRVVTFDEAFRSRIHFRMRFAALDADARETIWRGIICSLHETKVIVEIDELLDHASSLAGYTLNGRQIENTARAATRFANFRGETLNVSHFETVMRKTLDYDR